MPSQDAAASLIIDTAPLLTAPLASLLPLASRFYTTADVVEEVRNKGQRERLEREWGSVGVQLEAKASSSGEQARGEDPKAWEGLKVREPSAEGIAKVTSFAKQTGDIAVLSTADIRVVALAYDVEVEANGTWRLRDKVGGKRVGKDPEKKKARLARKLAAASGDGERADASHEEEGTHAEGRECEGAAASQTHVDGEGANEGERPSLTPLPNPHEPEEDDDDADWSHIPIKTRPTEPSEAGSQASSSVVSESDPSWITPDNIHLHQARDLGVFATTSKSLSSAANVAKSVLGTDNNETATAAASTAASSKDKGPTMKAALLTGDYAMQNVALQIGLNVLGVGGKRIRDVKTWILRCYGCFKLCRDATRKFCPSCGGTTLTRVSITYTPSSPTGYILHLKHNFQYRSRGTVYSIPSAKPGSASFDKGAKARNRQSINGAALVLREDQKEFQRGLKSVAIQKSKEERRISKVAERSEAVSVFGGWNDPDWQPAMWQGEKGRKGSGRGQQQRGVQIGKDGLPVIGFGKNPNEARRKR